MKTVYAIFLCAALLLLAGCGQTETQGTGDFTLLISDAPANIADFEYLNVHLSSVRIFTGDGFEEREIDTTVDLTQLVGDVSAAVLDTELAPGNYTKIELYVESTEGTTAEGMADVKVPSEKLQITKGFTITEGEDTSFVFDINVVKKGQGNEYNLLPVITESGAVGADVSEQRLVTAKAGKPEDAGKPESAAEGTQNKPEDKPAKPDETMDETEDETADKTEESGEGELEVLVKDAPADIEDFTELIVTFSQARVFKEGNDGNESNDTKGWFMVELNKSVDLTQLVDGNAAGLFSETLDAGTYNKVELWVASAEGLVNNESADVKVPSNKLQIVRKFTIGADETTTFLFDINVVKKGVVGVTYNLLPVIGKSGVVGEDIDEEDVNEVECTLHEECETGEACVEGACESVDCIETEDCAENQTCTDYVCEDNPECTEDAECTEGNICVDEECVVAPEDPGDGNESNDTNETP